MTASDRIQAPSEQLVSVLRRWWNRAVVAWIALALAGLSLAVGILSAGAVLARLVRRPNGRWRRE